MDAQRLSNGGKDSMANQEHLSRLEQRGSSQHHPTFWWHHTSFRLIVTFLLGMSVGFLFRPLEPSSYLIVPPPPLLSLWGAWLFPVFLLFSLMMSKTAYLLLRQGNLSLIRKTI